MKHNLFIKARWLLCTLFAVFLTTPQVWGEDVSGTISLSNTSGTWNATTTGNYTDENGLEWSRSYSSGKKQSIQNGMCQFGNSNNPCTSLVFTTSIGEDVTLKQFSASFTGGAAKTSGVIKLYNGGTEIASENISGTATVICKISESTSVSATNNIKVEYSGTAGSIKISEITYKYSSGSSQTGGK